jgi:hypothetical protein
MACPGRPAHRNSQKGRPCCRCFNSSSRSAKGQFLLGDALAQLRGIVGGGNLCSDVQAFHPATGDHQGADVVASVLLQVGIHVPVGLADDVQECESRSFIFCINSKVLSLKALITPKRSWPVFARARGVEHALLGVVEHAGVAQVRAVDAQVQGLFAGGGVLVHVVHIVEDLPCCTPHRPSSAGRRSPWARGCCRRCSWSVPSALSPGCYPARRSRSGVLRGGSPPQAAKKSNGHRDQAKDPYALFASWGLSWESRSGVKVPCQGRGISALPASFSPCPCQQQAAHPVVHGSFHPFLYQGFQLPRFIVCAHRTRVHHAPAGATCFAAIVA